MCERKKRKKRKSSPSFTAANPPVVNQDDGMQTVTGWVTSFTPGPANEMTRLTSRRPLANSLPIEMTS